MCSTWVHKGGKAKQPASWLKGGESHNDLPQLPELGINRADLIIVLETLIQLSSGMNENKLQPTYGLGTAVL